MNGSRQRITVAVALVTLFLVFNVPSTRSRANAAPTTTTTAPSCPLTNSNPPLTLPSAPTGIIAYDIYSANQGDMPFSTPVMMDTSISGVDLAIGWKTLEPDASGYGPGIATPIDWTVLDCLFSEADHYGKFVVLTIIPGFDTPSWAEYNVDAPEFQFKYHEPPYPPKAALPEPWDPTYLARWYIFLRKVDQQFEMNTEFRMIAAAGPTSVAAEMSLPDGTGDPALKTTSVTVGSTVVNVDGSDVTMWKALQYTPERYEAAWASTFSEYARIFKDRYISLGLVGGLPIGNEALSPPKPSPSDNSQRTATPVTIIADGRQHEPQFVLQENGLSATSWPALDPNAEYNDVKANCAVVPTGYQTKNPQYEGNLQDLLDKGVAGGARFLEIYVHDVVAANDAAFSTAASEMAANTNCDPLSLRAVENVASANTPISLTATTSLDLESGDAVNIIENGRTLASCHKATCHLTINNGSPFATFSADVSYPDQPPLVTVSAKVIRTA